MESPHNIKIESYFNDLQGISEVIESVETALEEDSEGIQQLCGLTETELEDLKPLFTAAFTAFGELQTIISNFETITDCASFKSSFIGTQRKPAIFFQNHPADEPVFLRCSTPIPSTSTGQFKLSHTMPFEYLRKPRWAPLPRYVVVLSSD